MVIIIILVAIVAIVLLINSSSKHVEEEQKHNESNYEVKVEYPEYDDEEEKGSMALNEDGSISLFTRKKSRATLIGASEQIANEIMSICDSPDSYYEWSRKVCRIFMENRIELREVVKFRSRVRPIIEKRIHDLIAQDTEWESLGEKDKEDKEWEYREDSMMEFDDEVTPVMSGALNNLALSEPIQVPLMTEFINEYGADNLDTYWRYYGRKNPIITIQDVNYRKPFDELVKAGLAYTGKDLSVEELLSTLTLNELNEIASTEKKFTRKDKAIRYLMERDDISSVIDKNIALRAIFSLKPLPEKFKDFSFDKYSAAKSYYESLADVFVSLYKGYSSMKLK